MRFLAHGLVEHGAAIAAGRPWRGTSRRRRRAAVRHRCGSADATRRCRCWPTGTPRGRRSSTARPARPARVGPVPRPRAGRRCPRSGSRTRRRPAAPPCRPPRTVATMRRPASISSSSPAAWPTLSLTSLKRSRSRNSTANTRRVPCDSACARAIAASRRSSNWLRLGRPVSASCRAWWVSCCSARRRSPICASSSALASASSRVREVDALLQLACAASRRSCACLRARPMPMWWATKVSSSWSRTVKLIAGE